MEDSRVCPICDTANPSDALLCEVCGENLVPEDDAGEIGDQLSADGVVGFAVEDSEEIEEDIEFGATASDATMDMGDEAPSFDADDADTTDEEMMMAAPADETAAMDSFPEAEAEEHGHVEATEVPGHDAEAGHGEVEATEAGGDDDGDFDEDTGETEFADDADEAEFEHDDADEAEFEHDDAEEAEFEHDDADEAEFDHDDADEAEFEHDDADEAEFEHDDADEAEFEHDDADEAEFDQDDAGEEGPEYLYSPLDGTAFARGSAEYEEGFGPNGEELVATPPDAAFDALEAEIGGEVSGGASMDDDELAAAAAPSPTVSAEFKAAFVAKPKERPVMAPLPQPGTYVDPAVLTVYQNRQPVMRLAIDMDEVLIGRRDPVADAYPDLDLSELDPEAHISRKHAYIYRQNKNYTLYAVTNAGTQLNADLLDLGDRRALSDGDVIVLAGKIAMKFELPNN